VKAFLTNSLARSKFDGLQPKLTYDSSANPHEDFSGYEVNSRCPNICQDPHSYEKMDRQEDFHWSPPTRRQEEIDR
jgi:hypothetical protein